MESWQKDGHEMGINMGAKKERQETVKEFKDLFEKGMSLESGIKVTAGPGGPKSNYEYKPVGLPQD
jgi:hypothetical protein